MAVRDLANLSKRYNSASAVKGPGGPGHGPGGGPRGRMRGSGGKPKDVRGAVGRLFGYVSAYKGRMAIVFICMLLRTLSALAGSYMLRPIINNYIAVGRMEGFLLALGVLGGVYLTNIVFTYAQNRLMITVSQTAIEKIRNDLFASTIPKITAN